MLSLTDKHAQAIGEAVRVLYTESEKDHFGATLIRSAELLFHGAKISVDEVLIPDGQVIHRADKNYRATGQEFWACWPSLAREHPILKDVARGGGRPVVAISDFLTPGELRQSDLYREVFKPNRINDQIAAIIPLAASALVLTIGSDKLFGEVEKNCLSALHPHLLRAYLHRQNHLNLSGQMRVSSTALEIVRDGVISSTGKGRMRLANQKALKWIFSYFSRPEQSVTDLPRAIIEAIAKKSIGSTEIPGPEGTLRIDWSPAHDSGSFLLLTETRTDSVKEKARALGLSPRECEVAHWIAQGKTNDEISRSMGISRSTSRTHVENIFSKLQVSTRTAAAAKLMDGNR